MENLKQKQRIAISLFVVFIFISTVFMSFAIMFTSKHTDLTEQIDSKISSVSYTNSDVASLWIRRNGSDPNPFGWPNPNVQPTYGMNYFSTNVIQVSWSYTWDDINDTSQFPSDCEIYRQISCSYAEAYSVANHSLWDSRIKGAWIDDFQVSLQSPTNMSNIYSVLHAQDLTLGIVVYNRNYYDQVPYSWCDIEDYFDIVHYWFYPNTYSLLYPQFCGYEDDFETFRSWLPTDKQYWMGIYLHWYNVNYYPEDYSYEQMSIACKLIKLGHADRVSILENFWIQHNPDTAELVRDFLNNEYAKHYNTIWYWNSQTVLSFSGAVPIYPAIVTDIEEYHQVVSREGFTFESGHLQNFTIKNLWLTETYATMPHFSVINMRTGNYQYPYYDSTNETISFILEPQQKYRVMYFKLTTTYWNGTTNINSDVTYDSMRIIVNGKININQTLILQYCVLEFGNNQYKNSMYNLTKPGFGITIWPVTTAEIRFYDSIIQPVNRAFPYFFERKDNVYVGAAGTLNFIITRTIVACHTNMTRPSGEVSVIDSTFFQVQPIGATYNYLLFLQAPSRNTKIKIVDSLFYNYDVGGSTGIFLMAYNLHTSSIKEFQFEGNTIVGGYYGLWVDMSLTDTGLRIENHTSYNNANTDTDRWNTFRLDGDSTKEVIVETDNLYDWTIKSAITGPKFTMYYPYIDNGLWILTIDGSETSIPITTNSFVLSYVGPWLTYRNNFTLELSGSVYNSANIIDDIVWLFIIFIIPIAMVQAVPKIGYIAGMVISLLLFGLLMTSFLPYTIIGFLSVIVYVYRR
jgi:hypothetical protein